MFGMHDEAQCWLTRRGALPRASGCRQGARAGPDPAADPPPPLQQFPGGGQARLGQQRILGAAQNFDANLIGLGQALAQPCHDRVPGIQLSAVVGKRQ